MRKSPARNMFVVLLFVAWLSSPAAYGQKPAEKREVQDVTSAPAVDPSAASYYALLIGNNEYRYVTRLRTAAGDADAVAQLLRDRFGFRTQVLHNATRNDIITALVKYRSSLPENSNLLIFYAGHGHKDREADEAYWLPVDSQTDNNENWISADDITRDVRAIRSMHVMIVSDSCYSGALTRDVDTSITLGDRNALIAKMFKSKSRTLMSSGSDEPVDDGGPNNHSVFANALLLSLGEMEEQQFTAEALFQKVQVRVAGRSAQLPQYSLIRNSGHDFGDFVFSRGGKGAVIPSADKDVSKDYSLFRSELPEIACKKEPIQGVGPKIQAGDMVPCKLLDEPLKWLTAYAVPQLSGTAAQTKWTAMLIVTVDENGRVSDIRPRGGSSLQGMDSAIKAAAQGWQTNPPLYQSKKVKSSFALDIEFGQ